MAGERSFAQIPPDSTGKKIRHEPYHRVTYNNRVGNHIWQRGQEYQITGSVTETVIVFNGPDTDSGQIGIKLSSTSDYDNINLSNGDLIKYQGSTVATVVSEELIYVPNVNISGGNAPQQTVNVDKTGSMNIRFADGKPQTDAFGRLRISSGTTLGDYIFAYNTLPSDFSTPIVGNASVEHDGDLRALKLILPSGTPAANSVDSAGGVDSVAHTTNTYHHYYPGFSQEAIMTVALSDTGKNGVTRDWGYFEKYNGVGFRCDDATTGLKVFIRTNSTGSVTETVIDQADFNIDPLDGTGDSQMVLDLTDNNIYWTDIQWLGAGRVRFGTYYRGERVVMHEYYHEGALNSGKPNIAQGSLPLCFYSENNTTQLSESTMAVWCCSVHTEHEIELNDHGRNASETLTKTFDPTSIENGLDYELIGAFTPVKTLDTGSGGATNRTLYQPTYFESMGYDTNGDEVLYEIEAYVDPVIGGGNKSFSINQDEITDGNTAWMIPVEPRGLNTVEVYKPEDYTLADRPKLWGGGVHAIQSYVRGNKRVDLNDLYVDHQHGSFKNYADRGGERQCLLTNITPSSNTTEPTSIQINHNYHIHREGEFIKFIDITGTVGTDATNGLNYDSIRDNKYMMRITGVNTAELYEDLEFNTPVITNGLSYTSGGTMVGRYGDQVYFVIVAKPLQPTIVANNDITVHFNIGWKEVNQ